MYQNMLIDLKNILTVKKIDRIRIFSHVKNGKMCFVDGSQNDEYKNGRKYDSYNWSYAKRTGERVERIEKKDPLDLPPVVGQEYDFNGKKVYFYGKYDEELILICENKAIRDTNSYFWQTFTEGKTVRQYLENYDI